MSANPIDTTTPEQERPAAAAADSPAVDQAAEARTGAVAAVTDTLNAHKGKLAIGVAATLGLMIYYNWREKKLAKTDPDEYAQLKRLKAGLRAKEDAEHPAVADATVQAASPSGTPAMPEPARPDPAPPDT